MCLLTQFSPPTGSSAFFAGDFLQPAIDSASILKEMLSDCQKVREAADKAWSLESLLLRTPEMYAHKQLGRHAAKPPLAPSGRKIPPTLKPPTGRTPPGTSSRPIKKAGGKGKAVKLVKRRAPCRLSEESNSRNNTVRETDSSESPSVHLKQKAVRKAAKFDNPIASRFCHLCSRQARSVRHAVCRRIGEGVCRKAVCEPCFREFGYGDFEEAFDLGNWLCSHCSGICPERAQCLVYTRVNDRLREDRLSELGTSKNTRKRSKKVSSSPGAPGEDACDEVPCSFTAEPQTPMSTLPSLSKDTDGMPRMPIETGAAVTAPGANSHVIPFEDDDELSTALYPPLLDPTLNAMAHPANWW